MGVIWRSGAPEERKKTVAGRIANIPVRPFVHSGYGADHFNISFDIASKGGGRTRLEVRLTTSDFLRIAEEMVLLDVKAAKSAFSSALENPHRSSEEFSRKMEEEARKKHMEKSNNLD